MYHNHFTIQIDFFKYKRFKDGACAYKIPGRATLSFATPTYLEVSITRNTYFIEVLSTQMKSVKNSIHFLTKFCIKRVQSFSQKSTEMNT